MRFPILAALATALTLAATPALACDCHQGHAPAASTPAAPAVPAATAPVQGAQVVHLTVTGDGFVPALVVVKAGTPVTLIVTRKTDRTCATEIVMKDFGVNAPLPLDKAVSVTVTPKGPGAYRFACGMDMIAGTLQVQ
jgi:plastocyanin domain-containing protein